MDNQILFDQVEYAYDQNDIALDGVSLSVHAGEFVAILGHNGSGKSTLAKHINALFLPDQGRVLVLGMDTSDENLTYEVRRHAGMVFQNPDNQMVTTIVEEDVAFGPENLGVNSAEIRKRVDLALETVGMDAFKQSAPHLLSGGQKQRIAIAGILTMEPDILVLDEPTAMLDPLGRKEVIDTVIRLNKKQGITVVLITHFMEEAALADRIVVMSEGKIAMEGEPLEIFKRSDELIALDLDLPFPIALAEQCNNQGLKLEHRLTDEELVEDICHYLLKT